MSYCVTAPDKPQRPLYGPADLEDCARWAEQQSAAQGRELEVREESGFIFRIYGADGKCVWRDDR